MPRQLAVTAVLVALVGSGSGALCAQPPGPKKYAVLVGVNKYDHPKIDPLRYSVNDVSALAELLTKQGFECVVLTDDTGGADTKKQPTRENVVRELVAVLNRCRKADTVLVALSGHGCQFADEKDGYFVPSDGRPFRDRTDTLLPLGAVYSELDKSAAGLKVLIVDACRTEPTKNETTRGVFLDTVPVPKGIAALFACSNGEYALEAADLKHGVFFHHLLQGLKGEAADKGGRVTFGRLADHVQTAVSEDVKKRTMGKLTQSPNVRADISGPPPVLAVTAAGGGGAVAPPQPPEEKYPAFFYDEATGKELMKRYPPVKVRYDPSNGARPVAFGDDFARVLLRGEFKSKDGTYAVARLYDADTGKPAGPAIKLKSREQVRAFAPDGVRFVTTREREKGAPVTRQFDATSGTVIGAEATFWLNAKSYDSDGLRFSPDGALLLVNYSSGDSGSIIPHLYPLDGGKMLEPSVGGERPIWSQDGRYVYGRRIEYAKHISLRRTSTMKKVDCDAFGEVFKEPVKGIYDFSSRRYDTARYVAFSPDCTTVIVRVASTYKDASEPGGFQRYAFTDGYEYWSLTNNKLIRRLPEPPLKNIYETKPSTYQFTVTGERFFACVEDPYAAYAKHLLVFDLKKEDAKPVVIPLGKAKSEYVTWDHKGERLATRTYHEASLTDDGGYRLKVWDAATGKAVGEPIVVGEKEPRITFTPDGRQVVAVWESAAAVYEVGTGKLVRRIELSAD